MFDHIVVAGMNYGSPADPVTVRVGLAYPSLQTSGAVQLAEAAQVLPCLGNLGHRDRRPLLVVGGNGFPLTNSL